MLALSERFRSGEVWVSRKPILNCPWFGQRNCGNDLFRAPFTRYADAWSGALTHHVVAESEQFSRPAAGFG
jgi:hypothetical protein